MPVPDPGQGERAAILRVGRREDRTACAAVLPAKCREKYRRSERERNRRPRDFPGTWASVPFHADYIV